ncbi:MAG: GGDEF domain-containing protein, partial [Allorhizobium sp.]|uniref:GGDEF domain-containing protein n=1 Tax=Allorhizobium sp. TaxID=633478 RepID=UPI00403323EC
DSNYSAIVAQVRLEENEAGVNADRVLYDSPHHLAHFSANLSSSSRHFLKSLGLRLEPSGVGATDNRAIENTVLDETVATATLAGYTALGNILAAHSLDMLARLTGLYNRAFMRDHFDTLIKASHRRQERLAVIQIDLDRFKQINDTLGHAAGDLVLITTAERMRGSCRASDICARLGGDEFVMV